MSTVKKKQETQPKRKGRPPFEGIPVRRLLTMTMEQWEYSQFMAKATGKTWNDFMRYLIDAHRAEHTKEYAAAKRLMKKVYDAQIESEGEED